MKKQLLLTLALLLWTTTAQAQVAFDACSESHTGTTGSTSEASFSWTHTPVGTPAGVVVFVMNVDGGSFADLSSSVSYGAGAPAAISGGAALADLTEDFHVKGYFLGASVPTGAQTVTVTRTNNSVMLYGVACTVTAGGDTEVHEAGIVLVQANTTIAEQSVTDGSPGTNSVRFSALGSGVNSVQAAGANSTAAQSIDTGGSTGGVVRETTAGQGSRSIGWGGVAPGDNVAVHLAIKQAAGGGATCTGGLTLLGAGKCD